MTLKYSQRALIVLSLLGILSAVMSVLSVILIFQLRSVQTGEKESPPPSTSSLIPAQIWAVLLPVCTVLCALSLSLHLSSVVVCLLHGYFSTEVCGGEDDAERYFACMSTDSFKKNTQKKNNLRSVGRFTHFGQIVPETASSGQF